MSKTRLPNIEFSTRGSDLDSDKGFNFSKGADPVHRFMGLSLAGGKTDKACLAIVEYYPRYHKIFLTKIFDKIKNEDTVSADQRIIQLVDDYKAFTEYFAVDVPWNLPLCLSCKLKCPGMENCHQEHIKWMNKLNGKRNKNKKPKKSITPYTQRAAELYINHELEETFDLSAALGANMAPLLARAIFLKKRIPMNWIEVYPKLSIWRLGKSFGLSKNYLKFHRHAIDGNESREIILDTLCENKLAFVYEQDFKIMIQNSHAFEAFICAFTGVLKYFKLTEKKPEGFPKKESWIDFPLEKINWEKI